MLDCNYVSSYIYMNPCFYNLVHSHMGLDEKNSRRKSGHSIRIIDLMIANSEYYPSITLELSNKDFDYLINL